MSEQNPVVERYLSQLRVSLRRLPEGERSEIVGEINSHIAESIAAGGSLAEVLERLGPADRLARAYIAEALLNEGKPTLTRWLKAAGILTGVSLSSLVVIPVLGIFGVVVPVASAWGVVANIVQFVYPQVGYIGGTKLGNASPLINLTVGVPVNLIMIALGIGAFRFLKAYIRLSIKAIREMAS